MDRSCRKSFLGLSDEAHHRRVWHSDMCTRPLGFEVVAGRGSVVHAVVVTWWWQTSRSGRRDRRSAVYDDRPGKLSFGLVVFCNISGLISTVLRQDVCRARDSKSMITSTYYGTVPGKAGWAYLVDEAYTSSTVGTGQDRGPVLPIILPIILNSGNPQPPISSRRLDDLSCVPYCWTLTATDTLVAQPSHEAEDDMEFEAGRGSGGEPADETKQST
nr:hypothetical protein CFP56_74704 [Quercus suber]